MLEKHNASNWMQLNASAAEAQVDLWLYLIISGNSTTLASLRGQPAGKLGIRWAAVHNLPLRRHLMNGVNVMLNILQLFSLSLFHSPWPLASFKGNSVDGAPCWLAVCVCVPPAHQVITVYKYLPAATVCVSECLCVCMRVCVSFSVKPAQAFASCHFGHISHKGQRIAQRSQLLFVILLWFLLIKLYVLKVIDDAQMETNTVDL